MRQKLRQSNPDETIMAKTVFRIRSFFGRLRLYRLALQLHFKEFLFVFLNWNHLHSEKDGSDKLRNSTVSIAYVWFCFDAP